MGIYSEVPAGHRGLWRVKGSNNWVRWIPGGAAIRPGWRRVRDEGIRSGASLWVYRPVFKHLYGNENAWESYQLCVSPQTAMEIAEAAIDAFCAAGGLGDWGFFKPAYFASGGRIVGHIASPVDDHRFAPRPWR